MAGLAALAVVLTACTPTQGPAPEAGLPEVAPPLPAEELAAYSGVARLSGASNCTGTVIETGLDEAPAYLITNGHCVGDVGRPAQTTTVGLEWFGDADFFAVAGNESGVLTIGITAIEYSTMHTTDLAILRLDATLGDLRGQGVLPLPVVDAEPAEGAVVVNVGVPVQGLDPDDWVLRRGECALGAQSDVIESAWLWFDVWSNDCPGVIQGSSGSPLIADGAIAAVINTTTGGITEAMGGACWLNRPCEVVDGEPVMRLDTSYAQSVAGIGGCFGERGFELGGACPLAVTDVWAESGGGAFRGGGESDAFGRAPEAALAGRVAGSAITALVPLGDPRACREAGTYAGATAVGVPAAEELEWDGPQPTTVPVALPAEEGHWMLCAATPGGESAGIAVLFEVDRTPPILEPGATVEDLGEARLVAPRLDPPELSNVRFTWGPRGETDCSDPSTFDEFFIQPLVIPEDQLPATYCVVGFDSAGNPTPVVEIDVE